MSAALGTLVRVPDGRVGTVVFNGLTGVGIKWGRHNPRAEDFERSTGDCIRVFSDCGKEPPESWPWFPDAMLRSPDLSKLLSLPCVCEEHEVEILRVGLGEAENCCQGRT